MKQLAISICIVAIAVSALAQNPRNIAETIANTAEKSTPGTVYFDNLRVVEGK